MPTGRAVDEEEEELPGSPHRQTGFHNMLENAPMV